MSSKNIIVLSNFDPHPPSILGLEEPVVLEGGKANLATPAPFSDLDRPVLMPAFRFKVVNRRRGGRHREELWLTVCASSRFHFHGDAFLRGARWDTNLALPDRIDADQGCRLRRLLLAAAASARPMTSRLKMAASLAQLQPLLPLHQPAPSCPFSAPPPPCSAPCSRTTRLQA